MIDILLEMIKQSNEQFKLKPIDANSNKFLKKWCRCSSSTRWNKNEG